MKVSEFYTQLKNIYDAQLATQPLDKVYLKFFVEVKAVEVEGEYIPPGSGTYDEPPEVFAKSFKYFVGDDEAYEMSIDGMTYKNNKVVVTLCMSEYEQFNQKKYDYMFSEDDYATINEILSAFKQLKLTGNEDIVFEYNDQLVTFKKHEVKGTTIEFDIVEEVEMSDGMVEQLADEKYESALDNFMNPEPWYDDSDDYDD